MRDRERGNPMLRAASFALLLVLSALPLAAPPAAAFTCDVSTNPIPPAPVGGRVGEIWNFERDAAWSAFVGAVFLACGAAAYAIGVVNAQCVFYLGVECISVA